VNCTKIRLAAGLRLDPLGGSYSAPPDPLIVIRGREVELGIGRGTEGREWGEWVGRDGKGREARVRYLSRGPQFLITPLLTHSLIQFVCTLCTLYW